MSSPQNMPNWVDWARANQSVKPKISVHRMAQLLLDEWDLLMVCESLGIAPPAFKSEV